MPEAERYFSATAFTKRAIWKSHLRFIFFSVGFVSRAWGLLFTAAQARAPLSLHRKSSSSFLLTEITIAVSSPLLHELISTSVVTAFNRHGWIEHVGLSASSSMLQNEGWVEGDESSEMV
ncbi:hypothetical protein Bca101_067918 [Brassica carinata]